MLAHQYQYRATISIFVRTREVWYHHDIIRRACCRRCRLITCNSWSEGCDAVIPTRERCHINQSIKQSINQSINQPIKSEWACLRLRPYLCGTKQLNIVPSHARRLRYDGIPTPTSRLQSSSEKWLQFLQRPSSITAISTHALPQYTVLLPAREPCQRVILVAFELLLQ